MSTNYKCGHCGKSATKICSKCKSIAYCSVEHQRLHWSEHKLHCKKLSVDSQNNSTSSSAVSSSQPVVKSCRCMFCGEEMLLTSEEEAIKHMETCLPLQEQLNDTTHQFTLPESLKSTTFSEK